MNHPILVQDLVDYKRSQYQSEGLRSQQVHRAKTDSKESVNHARPVSKPSIPAAEFNFQGRIAWLIKAVLATRP